MVGWHEDLSLRYPVAPLLRAESARAELAIGGPWQEWSAVVASVLVRPGAHLGGARRDTVVQLTLLQTAPPWQFSVACRTTGPEVAPLNRAGQDAEARLQELLRQAVDGGDLLLDDRIAANGAALVHASTLAHSWTAPDFVRPLRSLVALAAGCR